MAQSSWVLCKRSHSVKWWNGETGLMHSTASNSFHYSSLPCLSLSPVGPILLCRPDHIRANFPLPTGHTFLLMPNLLWAGCSSCQSTRYSQGNPKHLFFPTFRSVLPQKNNHSTLPLDQAVLGAAVPSLLLSGLSVMALLHFISSQLLYNTNKSITSSIFSLH